MHSGWDNWTPVVLENIPDVETGPVEDGEGDPRQVYLGHIFYPGRFPLHIISKALSVSFNFTKYDFNIFTLSTLLLDMRLYFNLQQFEKSKIKKSYLQ